MTINLQMPDVKELKPRITVFGVGGAGGNAVNNMIETGLDGVDFVVANTDAQALLMSKSERVVQMGIAVTEGLGAGSQPEVGCAAAEEVIDEINDHLSGAHMVFITAGMGGGTGTGAAPVIAKAARELGILTVGVVTKPFHFEGARRMRVADSGIIELQKTVDTLIVIPNQNLFRVANEKTTFADAFALADQVLYSGVACITDLMVKEGLINLDFADVRSIMRGMGKAMMGTGEASGEKRAIQAAEAAIANPLLDEVSMRGARGLLISITGGNDLTLFEVDESATRIREEVDPDANIILGATFDDSLDGIVRVSVVATGIDAEVEIDGETVAARTSALADRLNAISASRNKPAEPVAPAVPAAETAEAEIEAELKIPEPAIEHVAEDPEVTIERYVPDAAAFAGPEPEIEDEPVAPAAADAEPAPKVFIPPEVVTAERAAPRMPQVDDFPAVAQRELRRKTEAGAGDDRPGRDAHDEIDDRGPIGILRRLAHVGLGRREEPAEERQQHREPVKRPRPAAREAAPAAAQRRPEAAARPAEARAAPEPDRQAEKPRLPKRPPAPSQAGNEALYQPRKGDLDPHGRAVPKRPALDEDQLEIPAFLRRQVN